MFTQLLHFVLCCLLTTAFTSECAPVATQKSSNTPFNSCSNKKCVKQMPTVSPLTLADNKQTQSEPKSAASTRTITIKSKITNKMLGYRKFGTHYPDKEFKILINGKELVNRQDIKENKIKTMKTTMKDNIVLVDFRYEFNHIWRNKGKGTRRVAFKIPPTTDTIDLTFNWKTDSQVLINGATFVKNLSDTKQ